MPKQRKKQNLFPYLDSLQFMQPQRGLQIQNTINKQMHFVLQIHFYFFLQGYMLFLWDPLFVIVWKAEGFLFLEHH